MRGDRGGYGQQISAYCPMSPAGHRLRVALQTSDALYLRPTPNPFAVALLPGSAVELPVIATAGRSARSVGRACFAAPAGR